MTKFGTSMGRLFSATLGSFFGAIIMSIIISYCETYMNMLSSIIPFFIICSSGVLTFIFVLIMSEKKDVDAIGDMIDIAYECRPVFLYITIMSFIFANYKIYYTICLSLGYYTCVCVHEGIKKSTEIWSC